MSETRRQIEAMLFKPVAGAFIYRAPNPWIFGRADHYIVDAQQKAELLDMLAARRPMLSLAVFVAGILLWGAAIGTLRWALSGHDNPTVVDFAMMVVMTFAALFLAFHLSSRRKLRRMRPILAAATRTSAAITSGEIRAALARTTSLKTAVILAAISAFAGAAQVFSLVLRNSQHPLFSDLQSGLSVFLLLLMSIMMVRYLTLAISKVRQTQAAA